jgi:uncharacterized protein (DUF924 family)
MGGLLHREWRAGGARKRAALALAPRAYYISAMDPLAIDILDFWFGDGTAARDVWFRKDPAHDAAVRERFGAAVHSALDGAFGEWAGTPRGAVALVLLLDQFTRNIHRDTPRMFAGDARALAVAEAAVAAGFDRALAPHERWFLYMPWEHAEDRAAQERSVALFARLAEETGLDAPLEWARKHAEVIHRFGRYPHRNALLGRVSTPEEIAFLAEPGSRF